MSPTPYLHINDLIDEIRAGLLDVFADRLVGLYLFGSLVTGDYIDDVSDIDLLATIEREVSDSELRALHQLHDALAQAHPDWADRIEVAYVSKAGLRTFRERPSRIAIISPGEPLHAVSAGRDWLMNWYLVQEADTTLYGPPPPALFTPISKDEFIDELRGHVRASEEWARQLTGRRRASYAILTLCRALYAHRLGEHSSKVQAARWAQSELPEWAELIRDAMRWRREPDVPLLDDDPLLADIHIFLAHLRRLVAFPPG